MVYRTKSKSNYRIYKLNKEVEMVSKNNIGNGIVITTGTTMLGDKQDRKMYIENVGRAGLVKMIKKYNISALKDIPKRILDHRNTDVIIAYDKKGGTEGRLFILPRDNKDLKTYVLNKGIISGAQHNHVILSAYA